MDSGEVDSLRLKDTDQVQDICARLTSAVVDEKPGIKDEDIEWLKNAKRDYKLALASQNNAKYLSKRKLQYIEEKRLRNIPRAEAEIGIKLIEALWCASLMINKTNPVAVRDNEYQGNEYVDACTEANRQFTDFFIKIHKKQSLTDNRVLGLFNTIFTKVGFDRELKVKGLEKFPEGVVAAVRAYLEIHNHLPGWDIEVATLEQDKHHGVDLVAFSPDKKVKRCYGVKGSVGFFNVSVTEVTEKNQMEAVREKITLGPSGNNKEKNSYQTALYRIFEYTQNENSKGENTKAYWVEAPSAF